MFEKVQSACEEVKKKFQQILVPLVAWTPGILFQKIQEGLRFPNERRSTNESDLADVSHVELVVSMLDRNFFGRARVNGCEQSVKTTKDYCNSRQWKPKESKNVETS